MYLLQASSFRRAAGESGGSGRCRMAVVLLLGTMAETGLARISALHRISLCSLVAIARIVGFQHRVKHILGNPAGSIRIAGLVVKRCAYHKVLKRTWWQCSVLNDILKRKFWGYGLSVFLCSFNVYLTLGQAHRPRDFGDIVGPLIEKNGHGEKEYIRSIQVKLS